MSTRAARLIAGGVLLACAGFAGWELAAILRAAQGGLLAYNDFFAQWSFARYARAGQAASIYDADALHRFQLDLDPALRQSFPFPYPPTYLFAVLPLGPFGFRTAQLLWDAVTLALFILAAFGRSRDWRFLPWVVLAPATVICLAYGQNGLLTSSLLVGGMRLMRTRKLLGGVLLGLATIKPQLGLVVPFALIAAREWRVLLAAGAAAAGLALLAAWAFGPELWPAWPETAAAHAGWLQGSVGDYRKPTVLATLALFGADPVAAQAAQIAVAILVVAVVCLCFARGANDRALAAAQSGTYLAVPFAFAYDLPMLVNAVMLTVRERQRSGRRWSVVEAGIVALGLLFPALTTLTTRFFYMNTVALALLFGLTAWRCLRGPGNESAPGSVSRGRLIGTDDQAE